MVSRVRLLLVAAALVLAACSTEPDVDWGQYAPGMQARIDQLADEGACGALEREREAASESRLKRYVFKQMQDADCY